MKTLITHINPHLDDIAAIWLLKRFHPDFKDAEVVYISADNGNKVLEETEDRVYLGVGRGKFDEHKGDLEDCAASLVWKDIKTKVIPDTLQKAALDELVDWVRLGDLGKLKDLPYPEFTVPGFLRVGGGEKDSFQNMNLGFEILDRILKILTNKQKAKKEWVDAVSFQTKWGKSWAVKGSYVSRSFCDALDGDLFLMVDPKYNSVQFYTPKNAIDLEPIYKKVKELDPQAGWFLHQSHHMVICGSGSAPDSTPTKLSFEELIEVAKSI